MTRIDKVLKELSELYEFNRKIKAYDLKKQPESRWRNAEKMDDVIETPVQRDNLRASRPWIKSSASDCLSVKDRGFLGKQMKQGAMKRAERDLKLSHEWNILENDIW